MKRIFISHSIQDKETAKMLSDFLMQMGIDGEKIMCSSLPFSQIPINQNIYDYLKEILQDDNIVVLLLSENYYKSATCLNEMGAAWIRELPMIPILLSGFKVEKVEGVIDNSKIDNNIILCTKKVIIINKLFFISTLIFSIKMLISIFM